MRIMLFLFTMALTVAFSQNNQTFYYLKVTSRNADVHVLVNGFPVYDIRNEGEVTNQVPINLALIGKGNAITIVAEPLGENAIVQGGISTYRGGEMVSTDDSKSGPLAFEFDIDQSMEKSFTFENDEFDFRNSLRKTPAIKDQKLLREYAVTVLTMIKQKETDKIISEMMPKIKDVAVAFGAETSAVESGMRQMLESSLFKLPVKVLERNEINVNSYCDGRVCELTDADGNPLIYIKQNDGTFSMRIFVAMVDGKLRIIR